MISRYQTRVLIKYILRKHLAAFVFLRKAGTLKTVYFESLLIPLGVGDVKVAMAELVKRVDRQHRVVLGLQSL